MLTLTVHAALALAWGGLVILVVLIHSGFGLLLCRLCVAFWIFLGFVELRFSLFLIFSSLLGHFFLDVLSVAFRILLHPVIFTLRLFLILSSLLGQFVLNILGIGFRVFL